MVRRNLQTPEFDQDTRLFGTDRGGARGAVDRRAEPMPSPTVALDRPPRHASGTHRDGAIAGSGWACGVLRIGPLLILLGITVVLSFLSPFFFTTRNLGNVLAATAAIAVLSLGQLLVILTRGIDLSVGSTLALASVVGALVFTQRRLGPGRHRRHAGDRPARRDRQRHRLRQGPPAPPVHHHAGDAEHRPRPRAVALGRAADPRDAGRRRFHRRRLGRLVPGLGDPRPGIAFLVFVLTTRIVWGRWIYAVGGNPEAARRTGIPVNKVLISVYVLSGLMAGVAGIITAGRLDAGSPTFGELAELDSIAAVVIGGASFLGGRGNVLNALVGALMIGVIRNGMNLLAVDAFFQLIVIGVVIVLAVEADVLRGYLEDRFRVFEASRP